MLEITNFTTLDRNYPAYVVMGSYEQQRNPESDIVSLSSVSQLTRAIVREFNEKLIQGLEEKGPYEKNK